MRLRVFDWLQRLSFRRPAGPAGAERARSGGHRKRARLSLWPPGRETSSVAAVPPARATEPPAWTQPPAGLGNAQGSRPAAGTRPAPGGAPPGSGRPGGGTRTPGGGGAGRARIREAPFGSAPVTQAEARPDSSPGTRAARSQPWYQVVGPPQSRHQTGRTREVAHEMAAPPPAVPEARAAAQPRGQAQLPFTAGHPEHSGPARPTGDGRVNCGPLESILWRQWDESTVPHPQAVAAVERLASFPRALQEKLADGLDAIFVGAGGVPDLDHMTELHGVPLPSGKATWDACAGAYGERKIVVGTRPSPTPDVVCHEVGHALDDLDSPPGKWQSDSPEFRLIYDQCRPYLASDFHRQRGGLGRKEFFADAFAAIASEQRPALVDMLSGNTRAALRVMLYFNRRYGI